MDVNLKIIVCGIFLSVVMSFLSVHSVKIAKVPQQIMATFGAAKKKIDAETPGKTPGADILQKPSLDEPKNSVFDTGKTPGADILQPSYQKPSLDEPGMSSLDEPGTQKPSLDEPGMPTPKKALSVILAKPPSPEPPPRSPEKQDAAGTATWAEIFPHSHQKAFPDPQLNAEAPELDKKALSVILGNAQQQAAIPGAAIEAKTNFGDGNVTRRTKDSCEVKADGGVVAYGSGIKTKHGHSTLGGPGVCCKSGRGADRLGMAIYSPRLATNPADAPATDCFPSTGNPGDTPRLMLFALDGCKTAAAKVEEAEPSNMDECCRAMWSYLPIKCESR